MKFTVDTRTKKITLIGSFKFEDLRNLQSSLPNQWRNFTFEMEPAKEYIYYPLTGTQTWQTLPGTWGITGQSGTVNCTSVTRNKNINTTFTSSSQTELGMN